MLETLMIDNLPQLKCVSDPFRIKLLELIAVKPKTGQQLADELDIPRAKIHYHLAELEKNGIIEIVKTEQKHSIIQKFYAPVAKTLIPSPDLLKFSDCTLKKSKEHAFNLQLNDKSFTEFKKELKKYIKKASDKNGNTTYRVTIKKEIE
ncbi:ArsR/SmtB family transcription factor [Macrococcoides caseolyticum]|uniref:ArsR/SmtB family transcription factor n=1 Tax=Macrococcoides caseolyticum TaxID=69966 RepID=UPI000C34CD79|nr:winged helix-turn-helix domain-containing protein [Macrococcus caseolyticus]PKE18554.1 ArsR family transcriptional regulator [Macrococcus caseolyticus]PKE62187.1 ArsR family transcriptional regulator [Macrococcus caseolyticus]PKF39958.1 ArsR family transcriptional regulator [Macrococcus caseolyticus]PKF44490.1 ArsR family transcriptional regulator [Macrococcus caseolyticus]QYA35685.1 helix-turn-helix domain-containing protein [Macrococcus caseolyticus]